jgi:hypothetical protein
MNLKAASVWQPRRPGPQFLPVEDVLTSPSITWASQPAEVRIDVGERGANPRIPGGELVRVGRDVNPSPNRLLN